MQTTIHNLRKLVREAITKALDEVRYIDTTVDHGQGRNRVTKNDPSQIFNQKPIKDTDTIRVFHGCDLKTAVKFAKEGVSGQQWQARKYSYEAGMNPIGLFVSTDFNRVKDFANPFGSGKEKHASVIIEFSVKAKDLDTPVWNNSGSYFGQGSNPQPFRNRAERDAQKAQYQADARNSEDSYVRDSDNPAMADRIFNNSEHQALFLGNLDPNMIKRFWVQKHVRKDGYFIGDGDYIPMNRTAFLKEYGNEQFHARRDSKGQSVYEPITSDKLFNPTEDFTSLEDVAHRFAEWEKGNNPKARQRKIKYRGSEEAVDQYLVEVLKDCIGRKEFSTLEQLMWPKQLRQMLGDDEYFKYFDKYGITADRKDESTSKNPDKTILKEYMEVWRDENIDRLAKQIFVDFRYVALTGDTKAKKTYEYTLKDGNKCKVNVCVNPDSSTVGKYTHADRTLTVNVGPDITLADVRDTLFHELTHAFDYARRDQGVNGVVKKSVTYGINGRQTKLTELVNTITYNLFDPSERNAWQAATVKGRERVDHLVKFIEKSIQSLANGSFKYEDQLFPNACSKFFGKDIKDWRKAKEMFIERSYKALEQHKRRLYKNLLAYQDTHNDDISDFTPDISLTRQSHDVQMTYAEFIAQSAEVVADQIIRHYTSTVKGLFDAELDTKPFVLKYTPYGEKVNIKVLNYLRRPRATGYNGKELMIWPITAIKEIENCVNCVLNRDLEHYKEHYNAALSKLVEIIKNSCPQHWHVRE